MFIRHEWFEKNAFLLLIGSLLTISIGGIVEIVPLFTIETTVEHRRYNLVCHQVMYPLREERQFVGIFVNVTHSRNNEEKLDHLRTQTILQAQELLEHQLQMAENIARFLGESTAKGEDLVEKLMVLAEEEGDTSQRKKGQWLRDMYTSK